MLQSMMPSNRPSLFQLLRPHLLALGLYFALSVVSLNNLVLHFATALPGAGGYDYSVFYWNLWWVKYALFNLHRDPMFSNYALYPNTVNLSLHTLGFTLGLFTAPLQPFLDLKLIYNGTLVGSFIASGYCTYLFLNRHVQIRWLAILGGALFAFTPSTIDHASNGHLHLLATWWIPLSLLLWDGVIARRGMRWRVIAAGGLGLTFYLAWMSGLEPLMWSGLLWAPYALYTWMTECQGLERMRVLGLALVTSAVLLGPAMIEPIPATLQTRGISFPRASLDTAQAYSYRLEWLFSRDPDRLGDSIGHLIPFLTLFSLPLGGRRQRWLWLGIGLGLFILALGPRLQGTNVPLPYLVLHNLLDGQYRMPERFMTPATSALAAFIILSLDNLFERRISLRWLPWLSGVCIVGLVFDSGMLSPFPTRFMPDYRIYHEIGRDPAEYTLMEVPVSPASGFTQIGPAPDLQYYAYIHHKRLITGFISRLPGDGLDRYERSPLIRGLSSDYALPPLDVATTEMADKLNRWDIRYVLVHRDRLNQEHALGIIAFLNVQPELCLVDAEGDLLAYRRIAAWAECPRPELSALPSGKLRLTLGQSGDVRYVGPGWYDIENIGGPQGRWAGGMLTSTLRVLLPRQDLRASFNAFAYPEHQVVTVRVNGQPVAHFQLTEAWRAYQFDIAADVLPDAGPTLIELEHAKLLSASEHTNGQSPDQRPLAAAYSWFEFTPR